MTRSRGWFTPPAVSVWFLAIVAGHPSHVPRTMASNSVTWNTPPQNITTKANDGCKAHGWDPGPVQSVNSTLFIKALPNTVRDMNDAENGDTLLVGKDSLVLREGSSLRLTDRHRSPTLFYNHSPS
ncbi:predicted protein [Verticillium alfalfae VaMs.102]|uniref:Predicted protein n=1 Tax=Verticillium alfalfae (strain VaMs.102 / ATCC MYA-4576 / FGSC 10136) TaxID=526221 RepID=C9SV31_VERA1|nr:predicted protein [Verticillium alfalfae VaMs.102]EEY22646.1 predicted protein [Verticillium alfalfae VaMs.102]